MNAAAPHGSLHFRGDTGVERAGGREGRTARTSRIARVRELITRRSQPAPKNGAQTSGGLASMSKSRR